MGIASPSRTDLGFDPSSASERESLIAGWRSRPLCHENDLLVDAERPRGRSHARRGWWVKLLTRPMTLLAMSGAMALILLALLVALPTGTWFGGPRQTPSSSQSVAPI